MALKLSERDFVELSSDPLKIFRDSIKSRQTLRQYEHYLRDFLCNVLDKILEGSFEQRAKQFLDIAKTDPKKLSQIIYAYAGALKSKTDLPKTNQEYIETSAMKGRFKPIQKFLDMHDIPFNWTRLRSTFPESRYDNPDARGYTKEEIRTILKHSRGPIDNAIILVASSSGIRSGSFDFKWGDVMPVYKIGKQLSLEITESEEGKAEVVCAIITAYRELGMNIPHL